MMKGRMLSLLALGLALGTTLQARADLTTTFTITDVGTFTGYTDTNTTDTFTGSTGFVGIYPNPTSNNPSGPAFVHLFGLEYPHTGVFSETEMQVDISALAGANITSAFLSYTLQDHGGGLPSQLVTVTSYTADGTLSFNTTPPSTNLGSMQYTSNTSTTNTLDVTSLVQPGATAGSRWLGLFLAPNGPDYTPQYTFTSNDQGNGGSADSADVRLTVNYTPATTAVPEPSTMLIAGLSGVLLVLYARRRRAAA